MLFDNQNQFNFIYQGMGQQMEKPKLKELHKFEQNIMPKYIVPKINTKDIFNEITNALKNTAEILLAKTSSTFPIFNSLYIPGPGLDAI